MIHPDYQYDARLAPHMISLKAAWKLLSQEDFGPAQ